MVERKPFEFLFFLFQSLEGLSILHSNADATSALDPPHTFVPWIVVNGQHTDEIQQAAERDLFKLVCDSFVGSKPEVCKTKGFKKIQEFFKNILVKLEVL